MCMPTAPCVVRFPEDTHVQEGEGVLFQVEVTGVPQPKLRWYHDGEEVVADYSKELSEDGSLTMPSAETKHSGVYQLVAVNSAGRVEREVKLTVEPEGEEPVTEEPSYDNVTLSGAVSVSIFGNHVEQRHSKNNKPFKDEYEVSLYEYCYLLGLAGLFPTRHLHCKDGWSNHGNMPTHASAPPSPSPLMITGATHSWGQVHRHCHIS